MTDEAKTFLGWCGAIALFTSMMIGCTMDAQSKEGDQLCHQTSYRWSSDPTIGDEIKALAASDDTLSIQECQEVGDLIKEVDDRRVKDKYRKGMLGK